MQRSPYTALSLLVLVQHHGIAFIPTTCQLSCSKKGALSTVLHSSTAHKDHVYERELFSVAPMMGHTNRHYRYFFRQLSKRAHLYTEMIPSSQIVRAYKRARQLYLGVSVKKDISSDEVFEVMQRLKIDPSIEYQQQSHELDDFLTLHQLVGISKAEENSPIVLQLGGNNPKILGEATLIGAAFANYTSVNLNCGCPSNAIGGRSGGCALMKDADLVARCVEEMHQQAIHLDRNYAPTITVKHRLGVRDASTFDAVADWAKRDEEAVNECSSFVRTVSLAGSVPKFHVHARLGLLGEFVAERGDDRRRQTLWTPGSEDDSNKHIKIDHKREQERARRRAREAVIMNRNLPPLRPAVVHRLSEEFPHLQFVANGGIENLASVKECAASSKVVGAMVGRAAINHPCSFSSADDLWGDVKQDLSTRGQVLEEYIQYCDKEETRLTDMGVSSLQLEALRRRLISVPFHLFVGENGSDKFQRRLTKLKDKTSGMKASSVLSGAASFVPPHSMNKCINDFVAWDDIAKYEFGIKRGSAMKRIVY